MRTPVEQRFMSDPFFHQLVETFLLALRRYDCTPSEVREAAMLACTIRERESMPIRDCLARENPMSATIEELVGAAENALNLLRSSTAESQRLDKAIRAVRGR